MRIQIYSVSNEMEAKLIKSYLENAGISTTFAPGNDNYSITLQVPMGPLYVHDIFVEKDKVDEAKKLLREMPR